MSRSRFHSRILLFVFFLSISICPAHRETVYGQASSDVAWVDDNLPANAVTAGDAEGWNWINSNPSPISGLLAHQSIVVSAMHQHYFYGSTQPLTINAGDTLYAYVYLDPANVPTEVMLQWNDGSWLHRAYWGANQIPWGTDSTEERRYMGPLPAVGQWVRLEVPAVLVNLEGHSLNGMAFTLYGGRATWDRAGKSTVSGGSGVNLAAGKYATQSSTAAGAPWALPAKAIDGIRDGNFAHGSVTHTEYNVQPWWQVDLGDQANVNSITLWNRTDCTCPERLTNFYVLVSDDPFNSTDLGSTLNQPGVTSYYTPGGAGPVLSINVGRTARYVRVQLVGTNFLSLAEVEVFGNMLPAEGDGNQVYTISNVAAAANGGQATASSTISASYPASAAINGDRTGIGWANGAGGWNDATYNQYPDSLQVQFNGLMSISEIDVITLQDSTTLEPTVDMTFSSSGITDFNVWYLGTDGQWHLIASVTGNNKVLRRFQFSSVSTDRIRVDVLNSLSKYSRIVELEAWGRSAFSVISEPSSTSSPDTPSLCENKGRMDPCELARNLLSAIRGNRSGKLPYGPDATGDYWRNAKWSTKLDWNYNNWRSNGSQNIPTLAHALALWRDPTEYGHTQDEAVDWWKKYLDCQIGDVPCPVSNPGNLQYWKASELFSNTYDGETTTAVITSLYWATDQLNAMSTSDPKFNSYVDLANKARRYLRLNWTIYALGAGKGPATKVYNRFNHKDPDPDNPSGFDDLKGQTCNINYDGPFIPLAGMRSTPEHTCAADRGPLLARALGWVHKGPREYAHIQDIMIQITSNPKTGKYFPTENAFALDAGFQGVLLRHINGKPNNGEDTTTMMFNFLHNIRTAVTYHFIGASIGNNTESNEARMTLMEDNVTAETAPTFAVTYEFNARFARILFPWSNHAVDAGCQSKTDLPGRPWRHNVTAGWAQLKPSEINPMSLFATSSDRSGASDCKNSDHGVQIQEEFNLPSNWQMKYHIKFGPGGPPVRLQ